MTDMFINADYYVHVRLGKERAQRLLNEIDEINNYFVNCPFWAMLPKEHWVALMEPMILMQTICKTLLECKEGEGFQWVYPTGS